jgi:F420-dependent oxidoreductase-like protein
MDIGLMVEGQNGLTWERWSHILGMAERLGFPSVFRSDHYFIGAQQPSLEAYLSFVLAAKETRNIRFGPLVSPVTFRSPVDVGRMAAQIDLLSGGRFVMGLGAGWNEAEHKAYGILFPPVKERFDRLEEALQLIPALWSDGATTHNGLHYSLQEADCQPKPARKIPVLIGGTGEKRTLKLVAKYADEWNAVNLGPEGYRKKLAVLEEHCAADGRDIKTVKKSMMVFAIVGATEADLDASSRTIMGMFGSPPGTTPADFRAGMKARGLIAGGTDEVVQQLGQLAEAGLSELQFQHFNFGSDAVPEYLASEIAPRVKAF